MAPWGMNRVHMAVAQEPLWPVVGAGKWHHDTINDSGEAAEGNLLENKNEVPVGKMMAAPRSQKSWLTAKSLESDLGSNPASTLWKPSDLEQVTSPFWVSVSHLQNENQEG